MYPPPILYNSLNSYDRYKMDIVMSYYLQGKFNKTIEDKSKMDRIKIKNVFLFELLIRFNP